MIRTKIKMEEPTPLGKYLGCAHKIMHGTMPAGGNPRITPGPETHKVTNRVPVSVVEYDMSAFLVSCVDKYLELAKLSANSLKFVETPYLDSETHRESHIDEDPLCSPDVSLRPPEGSQCSRAFRFKMDRPVGQNVTSTCMLHSSQHRSGNVRLDW